MKHHRYLLLILILFIGSFILQVDTREHRLVRAQGTGEVLMKLSSPVSSLVPGQNAVVSITIQNTTQRQIGTRGMQAVISADNAFQLTGVHCLAPFNVLVSEQISGQTATVMCGMNMSSTPFTLSSTPTAFATIDLTVRSNASSGSKLLSFTSTRVTEAGVSGSAPDVSNAGESLSLTINTAQETLTPAPTNSPAPTFNPTPTPPSCDVMKRTGDYDCNGIVNLADKDDWIIDFIKGFASLSLFEYWRRAVQ